MGRQDEHVPGRPHREGEKIRNRKNRWQAAIQRAERSVRPQKEQDGAEAQQREAHRRVQKVQNRRSL